MRKRERFIIASVLLALGLLTTQIVPIGIRPFAILLFCIATYFISAWALARDLDGVEWFTVLPTPAGFALSVSLFYFLLPSNIFSRLFIISLFGVGMYAIYLMSNIYAIGKVKTIQLLRAAHAVGSFFLLVISLFFFNFIFSLRLHPILNALFSGLAVFPIALSSIWALELEPKITKQQWMISIVFALTIFESALAISFLPVGLWTASLFLTGIVYVGYGLLSQAKAGKLFVQTAREYGLLLLFVTISFFLLIPWK